MVVTNFQLGDAGLLPQTGLQLGQNALGVVVDGAQFVHLGVVALRDNAAVLQGRGRFGVHSGINFFFDIGQRVDLRRQLGKFRAAAALGLLAQSGQTVAGLGHGVDLFRGRRAVDRAGHHALEVGDVVQFFGQVAALDGLFDQALHGVQALVDSFAGNERLFDPAAEHPLAHGRAGLVQHPEQRSALFAAAQRLGQFQIGPRHRRKPHELRLVVGDDGFQTLHALDLGVVQVFQKGRHREADIALFADAGPGRPFPPELIFQRDGHQTRRIALLFHQFDGALHVLFQVGGQLTAVQRAGVHQHLAGMVAAQFGDDRRDDLFLLQFRDVGRAGGDIGKAETRRIPFDENARDVVVFIILQHAALDNRSRREHPDDIALDETLRLGGVLHLLADGDLVAFGDQPCHIAFVAVERHAAHGGALLLTALFAGQRQVQLPRSRQGIVEEHLVKVADAVEQDLVLMLFFDLKILLHHGRQFRHGSPPFSRCVVFFLVCSG